MPARRHATVGDEEALRGTLRSIVALHPSSASPLLEHKPFSINLMEIDQYIELDDASRESMMKIVDGYPGAHMMWRRNKASKAGIIIPPYRFSRASTPHMLLVTFSKPTPEAVHIMHSKPAAQATTKPRRRR